MGLINFTDIDCLATIDKTNKIINFNGQEIQIVNYLSASDKFDLIITTVQKAFSNSGFFDDFKAQLYFNLNVMYLYTNIVFSLEDREDEFALFDKLKRSGLMDAVLAEIDTKELEILYSYVLSMQNRIAEYNNTTAAVVSSFLETLPEKLKSVRDFVNGFDPEKLQVIREVANNMSNSIRN